MGGIHHDHVRPRFHQRRHAVVRILAGADAGPGAQLALLVLAGVGERLGLGDVLHRHHALELEPLVHQQHLFDAVLVQERGDGAHGRILRRGNQPLPRRHHLGHLGIAALLEADVPAGDDAEQIAPAHHRHAGDVVLPRERQQFAHRRLRPDDDGIPNHPALELLHRPHLAGLRLDGHVLVDDAHPALLRQRDGEAGLRDRIHRRRHEGDVQPQLPREPRPQRHLGRQHLGVRRQQQHVVVGKRFVRDPQHGWPLEADAASYAGGVGRVNGGFMSKCKSPWSAALVDVFCVVGSRPRRVAFATAQLGGHRCTHANGARPVPLSMVCSLAAIPTSETSDSDFRKATGGAGGEGGSCARPRSPRKPAAWQVLTVERVHCRGRCGDDATRPTPPVGDGERQELPAVVDLQQSTNHTPFDSDLIGPCRQPDAVTARNRGHRCASDIAAGGVDTQRTPFTGIRCEHRHFATTGEVVHPGRQIAAKYYKGLRERVDLPF